MSKKKVLFVCIHNSARSQMAETFLNQMAGDKFEAQSAGIEPGILNPIVIESMKEIGIDISKNRTKDVFEFYKSGKIYNHVITVCDEASAERCPIFRGLANKLHWSFTDPSTFQGTHEEKLKKTGRVRDEIKNKIESFIIAHAAQDPPTL